ncbi:MAG: hypothetical protein KatS3mg109_1084 [Pirellulaceae bacterium]|nr:MAG: hypothetical protein KatS3mg109_1043 [Pirellulaceae bacterium]GIW90652.1 MAG: hypothetical protein KatS3mg109_1084 [Pirellulaceae bacterium]GIW93647.1 MAG: hypothetical protein KatS3mg110_1688 [Pirellulaceae bacterium]
MGPQHYVRIGALGWVGRFAAHDPALYPRGCRVVCRTQRGLELGEILSRCWNDGPVDGLVLRRMTVEDHLLAERLERRRHDAFTACQNMLRERGLPAVLVDVEQLFDGATVYFYFLGEVSDEVGRLAGELAELYAAKIEFTRFHETLLNGCGPGCGTEAAAGCRTACSSCSVVSACRAHAKK